MQDLGVTSSIENFRVLGFGLHGFWDEGCRMQMSL